VQAFYGSAMSPKQAFEALGLGEGATLVDVKAAYRRRGRETHPDTNPNDPDATEKFQRVQEAYDRLKQHFAGTTTSNSSAGGGGADPDEDFTDPDPVDPVSLVRGYLIRVGIVVLGDGFLENVHHIKHPQTRAEFHQYLRQQEISFQSLLDDMTLNPELRAAKVKRLQLGTALRKIISEDAAARKHTIFAPLIKTLGPKGRELMHVAVADLVATIFEGPADLITAGLLHFVWQVQRKAVGLDVSNHLVPVVWSAAQGTGKSTFVRHFCAPLKELFSPPVAIEDFIDTRFSSALAYAVIFLDEIPPLTPLQVDALKLTVSSEEVLRRQLGTSKKMRVRQRTTGIGTANGPIERYFPDPSGHRRFLSIEMVDGRNRPEIWAATTQFDFQRLWRMIDAKEPSPIVPFLEKLRAYQAKNAPQSPLLIWLLNLDVGSEEMVKFCKRDGFAADPLRLHFNACTNLDWTRARFSAEMDKFFVHPETPFAGKRVVKGNTYYRLNR
jgi:hypothetical protein